ncbi:hypothetical protein CISG_03737 [Coccidioides immitis RMSCC 3703]|uniref:Uncharacterized protein n=1 Tax=Coccidioides immitis RMSCC 3703 TaxID=454286 RepID=A0A0J8TIY1_COCIT|nr:hypothetical protein CISG_03737 [Coccidioides immitis RMSCC 3703]
MTLPAAYAHASEGRVRRYTDLQKQSLDLSKTSVAIFTLLIDVFLVDAKVPMFKSRYGMATALNFLLCLPGGWFLKGPSDTSLPPSASEKPPRPSIENPQNPGNSFAPTIGQLAVNCKSKDFFSSFELLVATEEDSWSRRSGRGISRFNKPIIEGQSLNFCGWWA